VRPTTQPRVALLQTLWRECPEENYRRVLDMLDDVHDVDLILLPEFFLGAPFYFPGREHLKGVVDQTIPGPVTDKLAEICRKKGCYMVCGTVVERDGDDYYNTAALLDDEGRLVAKARKTHRFAAEMVTVRPGYEQVLVDTPFGRLGICVCSDFWIMEMPRMLVLQGAEIIAVPGAALRGNIGVTRPCIQANSAFNVCYTLLAGGVGKITGLRAGREATVDVAGHTTIAAPERLLGSLDEQEAVLYAELDMNHLRLMREVDLSFKRSLYFCLHGRLPELYGGLQRPYTGASNLESLLDEYLSTE
jgi:predicted amidohydrolase